MSESYTSATQSAAFCVIEQGGCLHLTGEDRVAFLQRQTTNDIRLLKPGMVVPTVLTSPTARILDVFYLLQSEQAVEAVTLPGTAARALAFLRSRIFFMDKVSVSESSAGWTQIDLTGPQVGVVLKGLGLDESPAAFQVRSLPFDGGSLQILNCESLANLGYRILVPSADAPALLQRLAGLGAAQLDAPEYQALRIEAGVPAAFAELTEEYTPLETGLEKAISGSKGCYTGQEVIARQVTYDKVTQSLCGLRLEQMAEVGQRLWAEGKAVGVITSVAISPRFGLLALGIVKRSHSQPGVTLSAGEQVDGGVPALVTALPFG